MKRNLLRACAGVQLLGSQSVAVFGDYLTLRVNIQNLNVNVHGWAMWGVTNEFGVADTAVFDSVLGMFDKIRELCHSRLPPAYKVGDKVEVHFKASSLSGLGLVRPKKWVGAVVTTDNEDGTFNVQFEDGEVVTVPDLAKGTSVRKVKTTPVAAEGASVQAPVAAASLLDALAATGALPSGDGKQAKQLKHSCNVDSMGRRIPLAYWQVIENHAHAASDTDYSPVPKLKYVFEQQDLLLALNVDQIMFRAAQVDFCGIKKQGEFLAGQALAGHWPGSAAEKADKAEQIRRAHKDGHDTMKSLVKEAFAAMRSMVFGNRQAQMRFFHAKIGCLAHMVEGHGRQAAKIKLIKQALQGEICFPKNALVTVEVGSGQSARKLAKVKKIGSGSVLLGAGEGGEQYEKSANAKGKQPVTYTVQLLGPGQSKELVEGVSKSSIQMADICGEGTALDADGIIVRGEESRQLCALRHHTDLRAESAVTCMVSMLT
jgi:hypothetical protein